MADLPNSWPTAGPLDFEYQTYTLLAYLQSVEQSFNRQELYPVLTDLITHYRQAQKLKLEKESLQSAMPKNISGLDFTTWQIKYENLEQDNWLKEMDAILGYALPKMQASLEAGKLVFEQVMQMLTLESIGIVPLRRQEGYVLLQNGNCSTLQVYRYAYRTFYEDGERFGSLQWEYLEDRELGILNTVDSLKVDLIKRYQELPNPATFWLRCQRHVPHNETLLPIAKRRILRALLPNAA